MIKLVVLDLDGTLLNDESMIQKENQKTINYYENKGIRFALASGRSVENIMRYAKLLNLEKNKGYIIGNNGQAIYSYENNTLTANQYIDATTAKKIYFRVINKNYRLYFFTDKDNFTNDANDLYFKQSKTSLISDQIFTEKKHFNNIVIKTQKGGNLVSLYDKLSNIKGDYNLFLVDEQTIQYAPKGVNKVKALNTICKQYSIKKEEVIVFGNGLNDLEMLKSYPNTYCPSNAFIEVKAVCQVLSGDNNSDAISKKLQEILK